MTTENAIAKRDELSARYDAVQKEKTAYENKAEELTTELLKLQGEYRLLVDLFPEAAIPEGGAAAEPENLSPEDQAELEEAKAKLAKKMEAASGAK